MTSIEGPCANANRGVVLITGSAAGIGAACVNWFASGGWTVVGIDRAEAALSRELGNEHIGIVGDVTSEQTWIEASAAIEQSGGLGVLVNNAATQLELPLLATSVEQFRMVLEVNVTGMFRGIRFADAHMRDGGAVVNLASILGFTADPLLGAYSVSKGAVLQLTRSAALELAPRGIRVNAVCPGAVRTPLTTRLWDLALDPDMARREMEQIYPIGHIAEPSDVADVVGFLATERSRSMTGSLVVADGGLTAANAEYGLSRPFREQ